jgi:GPH family glycoside/pentoside/hexuronide:cation symporter
MLASIVPLVFFTLLLWSPPDGLSSAATVAWVSIALFGSYTAVTIFGIPHEALGAELSTNYLERNRVFGVRHIVGMGGFLLGILALWLLETAADKRGMAFSLALAGTLGSALLILFTVWRLRERAEYQGRGAESLRAALADVFANPHARLLLVVFFIENIGTAVLMVLLPFFTAYILRAEGMSASFLALYAAPSLLLVPVWVRLAERFGKKNLWVFSMALLTCAFSGMFFVDEDKPGLMYALALFAGIGGGCGAVVGPSIQADVIDWDELHTGQRKEGSYFAVWNFVRKSATGLTAMLAGVALQAAGFVPNAEQSESARLAIRGLMALFPGACFAIGTLLFLRFSLNQAEHEAIRSELDARRARGG